MFDGSFDRHQHIAATVQNLHRRLILQQHPAQRALIGIVKIPRVGFPQHHSIKRAKMRHGFAQQPHPRQLQPMDRMVDVIFIQQLHFLHANRRKHRDRSHAFRRDVREVQDNTAAHTEADQMRALHVQLIQQRQHITGVRSN